jgi:hypothetical protein
MPLLARDGPDIRRCAPLTERFEWHVPISGTKTVASVRIRSTNRFKRLVDRPIVPPPRTEYGRAYLKCTPGKEPAPKVSNGTSNRSALRGLVMAGEVTSTINISVRNCTFADSRWLV